MFLVLLLEPVGTTEALTCGQEAQAHLLVNVRDRRISLCANGQEVKSFSVRLAKNGTGKTRSGDGRLPTGNYPLGKPRASKRYGIFIPIGYPTREQAASGFTGGGVGVHGPDRRVRWLHSLVNLLDTTDGCVGIATDDETKVIADWILRVHARRIRIG